MNRLMTPTVVEDSKVKTRSDKVSLASRASKNNSDSSAVEASAIFLRSSKRCLVLMEKDRVEVYRQKVRTWF
jgi:putative ubiquitin-RnfH superfamily antitoxin RatB of RatAB toxin-antitoxin module